MGIECQVLHSLLGFPGVICYNGFCILRIRVGIFNGIAIGANPFLNVLVVCALY